MSTELTESRQDLRRDMVLDAAEDYTDLAWYVHEARKALGITEEREIISETANAIRFLLDAGYIRAGYLTKEGFEVWPDSPSSTHDRILAEWSDMGRLPEMWEIVWFEATPAGESYAEREASES